MSEATSAGRSDPFSSEQVKQSTEVRENPGRANSWPLYVPCTVLNIFYLFHCYVLSRTYYYLKAPKILFLVSLPRENKNSVCLAVSPLLGTHKS